MTHVMKIEYCKVWQESWVVAGLRPAPTRRRRKKLRSKTPGASDAEPSACLTGDGYRFFDRFQNDSMKVTNFK